MNAKSSHLIQLSLSLTLTFAAACVTEDAPIDDDVASRELDGPAPTSEAAWCHLLDKGCNERPRPRPFPTCDPRLDKGCIQYQCQWWHDEVGETSACEGTRWTCENGFGCTVQSFVFAYEDDESSRLFATEDHCYRHLVVKGGVGACRYQ